MFENMLIGKLVPFKDKMRSTTEMLATEVTAEHTHCDMKKKSHILIEIDDLAENVSHCDTPGQQAHPL